MVEVFMNCNTITVVASGSLTDRCIEEAIDLLGSYYAERNERDAPFCLSIDLVTLSHPGIKQVMLGISFFRGVEDISRRLLSRVIITCTNTMAEILHVVFVHVRVPNRPVEVKTSTMSRIYAADDVECEVTGMM